MSGQYAFSKPTYGYAFDANPFGITFYVSNTTNPAEGQGSPGPAQQGRTPKNPFTSIATAVSEAVSGRGDTIVIQRGTYTENVNFNRAGLLVRAASANGYPDHVVISGTTTVNASGVTFAGLEFFSNSASAASVQVGNSTEASSVAFLRCSFASDGTTEPRYGLRLRGGNNHVVRDCRFIDNGRALVLNSGIDSFLSGVIIEGCEFLENTTYDLGTGLVFADVVGGGADGGVRNLVCRYNVFGRGEVTPSDYVNIVGTSSGLMAANLFANATNASADIIIPAGILYSANATEAGWSTARPS